MRFQPLFVAGAALLCAVAAQAYEFLPVGYESISMGGAGVASARGSMAGYFNPALLARQRHTFEFSLGGGVGLKEYKLADKISKVQDIDVSATLDRMSNNISIAGTTGTIQANTVEDRRNILTIQSVFSEINDSTLTVAPSAALGLQAGSFGTGVFLGSDAMAKASYNSNNNQLLFKDTSQTYNGAPATVYVQYNPGNPDTNVGESYTYNIIDNGGVSHPLDSVNLNGNGVTVAYDATLNEAKYQQTSVQYGLDESNPNSRIVLSGIALTEVPLSFAKKLATPFGALCLGGSVKAMMGATYSKSIFINSDFSAISDQFSSDGKMSNALGVDVGALYEAPLLPISVGVVAKNVNSPKFDLAGGGQYTVKPMLRGGVNFTPFRMLDIAGDVDLSKNETADGRGSQYIGAGVNFHPGSILSLRGGVMKNMAEDSIGPIATAGVGIGLKWLQLDIAAQASTKTTVIDGNKAPSFARVNVALVSKW